ncbi:sulfotransferase family 2 domain-containing protein [Isoptericola cucumis]|uniref:sulfotransferase family 2 domain-containing protein n=1 Tax=Isoptericola cucumis TaxID=1776856 RepID=UPI0032082C06
MPVFIKDDKAVLFVHIPKAGGSAIEKHFRAAGYRMHYRDGRTGPGTLNRLMHCSPQHIHAALCADLFRLERFTGIFTVVREPMARFRSEYAMRNTKAVDGERRLDTSASAVDRWVDDVMKRYLKDPYVYDNHIRPQSDFVVPGALVHRLEDGMNGLMTKLNESFGLGLPEAVEAVRTSEKVSGVSSDRVELSPAVESRLRTFYADDFTTFGY